MDNRFIIFSPCCNSHIYTEKCIQSVKSQDYDNYVHIVIDDNSNDNTWEIIKKNSHSKVITIRNDISKKWLKNSVEILNNIKNDEILICLDGDDWLENNNVLSYLNDIYIKEKCWVTYGQFQTNNVYWPGNRAENYTHTNFRNHKWVFTHLKTMKGLLWNNINKKDFLLKNNEYSPSAYDHAIMFPALEMSQNNKIKFINKILYVYNINNPLCIEKNNKIDQIRNAFYFRSKTPYQVLV